MQFFIDVVDA
jgi:hypothetical protein